MALALESSGTLVTVIGTAEQSLAAPTTNKTRLLMLDLNVLAGTDILIARIKTSVLSAGTVRVAKEAVYNLGAVGAEPIVWSDPVPSLNGATFTLNQTVGAVRSIIWAVYTLD